MSKKTKHLEESSNRNKTSEERNKSAKMVILSLVVLIFSSGVLTTILFNTNRPIVGFSMFVLDTAVIIVLTGIGKRAFKQVFKVRNT